MKVAEATATTEPFEDVTARDVQALADMAAALVSRLVPADVPLSWTPGICAAFDRLERLGAAGKTLLADRLAESKAWQGAGFASAAEYMAQRCGTSVTCARETLAASRRLGDLPATETRLRDGSLSTSQVQQITDAASRNPAAETELLDTATDGSSFHELRDACGRAKAAADKDDDDRNKRLRAQRRLRQHRDADGAWSLWAKGTVPDAARFNAAIEEIIDGLLQDAHGRGEALTREQAAYDALIEMADRVVTTDWTDLDNGPESDDEPDDDSDYDDEVGGAEVGGDAGDAVEGRRVDAGDSLGWQVGNGTGEAGAVNRQDNTSFWPGNDNPPARDERTDHTPSRPSSDRTPDVGDADDSVGVDVGFDPLDGGPAAPRGHGPADPGQNRQQRRRRRPRRKAQPYLGIVRADIGALRRGYPIDGEIVEIAGLGPISVDHAREILGGDTVLQLVLTNGVHANITNLRRSPNTAQRTALLAQMPCCSVRGCNRTWTQIDHRHDWAKTHITKLDHLDPLCWWHHRLKTLHGWALVQGTGKRDFVGPTDPRHPNNVAAGDGPSHGSAGVTATDTPEAGWDGLGRPPPGTDTTPIAGPVTDGEGSGRRAPTHCRSG